MHHVAELEGAVPLPAANRMPFDNRKGTVLRSVQISYIHFMTKILICKFVNDIRLSYLSRTINL